MEQITIIIFLLFVSTNLAQQKPGFNSSEIKERAHCADSAVIEFSNIEKLKNFEGKVSDPDEGAISAIIEIYSISKAEAELSPSIITEKKSQSKSSKQTKTANFTLVIP